VSSQCVLLEGSSGSAAWALLGCLPSCTRSACQLYGVRGLVPVRPQCRGPGLACACWQSNGSATCTVHAPDRRPAQAGDAAGAGAPMAAGDSDGDAGRGPTGCGCVSVGKQRAPRALFSGSSALAPDCLVRRRPARVQEDGAANQGLRQEGRQAFHDGVGTRAPSHAQGGHPPLHQQGADEQRHLAPQRKPGCVL